MTNTRIIFFTVQKPAEKLTLVCKLAQQCFEKRENLLIFVHDDAAAEFVDKLLWRFPEDSFLPHLISNSDSKDKIVITTSLCNLNKATHLLNLSAEASNMAEEFSLIYELMDMTSREKHALSKARLEAYQNRNFQTEVLT